MEKNPIVSIIIVHYKVPEQLIACIRSIYEQKTHYSYEIIVVDNDEKPFIEKELLQNFPKIIYIKNEKNNGYSGGNNLGETYAKGEFLFFLNPDTLFETNVVDILVPFLEKNKKTGIAAPLLLDEDKNPYALQGAKELTPKRAIFALSFLQKLFPQNGIANEYWLKTWNKKEVKAVDVVPGTAFMIRKALFEKIGKFDEHYFLYFEEHDLCNRVKEDGSEIYMVPDAKIVHVWGESTKKSERNIKVIFEKSRFYYLKKFYGLPQAVFTESILRFSKTTFLIMGILILAAFLRLYAVDHLMSFIGDFAWFYLSARDMVLLGNIPLVGIASSHPWIHQGAFWTYLLAPALAFGNFDPVAGGYLAGIIGILTVCILYFCTKEMFDTKTALFSAGFFASSPLVVLHARLPYHTAPIPLFVILFIYSLYKWTKGNPYYFPFSLFFLVVLYNFELATAVFGAVLMGLFGYGIYKRAAWIKKLWNTRIIFFSFLAFLVPLLPMLFYDISHGFPQTALFVAWVGYRLLVAVGYPPLHPEISLSPFSDMISFLALSIQRYFYLSSLIIAISIAFISLGIFIKECLKRHTVGYIIVALCLTIPLVAILVGKTPSDAYLPMVFVQFAICVGVAFTFFSKHMKQYTWVVFLFFILLISSNSFSLVSKDFLSGQGELGERVQIARQIISTAGGKEYTIIGIGEGSQFQSFTMPYEYLTWWFGHRGSKNAQRKIYVSEDEKGIHIK